MKNVIAITVCVFYALMSALVAVALPSPATVTSLGLEHGLSNSYVVSIVQDKRGVMWVATEDGLNIFDGGRFIPIYKSETDSETGLSGNELNTLLDDPVDSVMWIGTQRAGINAFDYSKGTIRRIRHDRTDPTSLVTDDVTRIVASSTGKLLVATFWWGVDLFDPSDGTFEHFNPTNVTGMPWCNIWTVADSGDGDNIYIGHKSGFMEMSLKDRRARNYSAAPAHADSLPGAMVYCIVPTKSGKVLVGTDSGIALFDPETKNFLNMADGPLSKAMVYDIKPMGNSVYWVATEFNGVFQLDLTRGFTSDAVARPPELEFSRGIQQLSNATFHTMQTDSFGNIWLGQWGSGIVFVGAQQPLFSLFDSEDSKKGDAPPLSSLSHRTVGSVAVDHDGKVWIGTDGGGINVFDGDRREAVYRNIAGSPRGNHIQASLCDDQGNLWFGAFNGGLFFYDRNRNTFSAVTLDSLVNEDVRAINQFGDTVFVAGGTGIYGIDARTRRLLKSHTVDMARDIVIDRYGQRWVGTFGSGLLLFDRDMNFIRMFNVDSGFPSNTVNDLFIDRAGSLWAATGEGLVRFINPADTTYVNYRHADGLASSFVSAVTQDNDGNIWVSTNKGISIVSDGNISSYDHLDNTPPGSFMSSSVALDSLGRIYFGALNGLCRFNPRDVLAVRDAPKAIITQFEVYGPGEEVTDFATFGQLEAGKRIRLKADQNTVSITANIADYSLAQRVEYRFRLEGFDEGWFSTGSNRAVYRNLPPGSYVFEVDTRMRNQAWSGNITSVRITVDPPLPLTWWAKLIYFLLAAGIILILLYLYQKRLKAESLYQIEKKQRIQDKELADERLRFYTNVTHELRTPLTLIVGPLEDSLRGDGLSESERRRITVINRNAQKLLSLVNQILDFRKSETANKRLCIMTGNIVSTVYETALKYKELISGSKIKINISANPESIVMPYDKEAVGMILDNLISNALKYTPKGSIDIRCRKGDEGGREYVEISVGDTGYGISAEALPHIFDRYYQEKGSHQASGTGIGLALVKNLVELHHGSISVDSKLNEGTTFTLRLWADESYPEAIHPDDNGAAVLPAPERDVEMEAARMTDRRMPVVLVVEDNEDLREYISESFTDLFEVKLASNGQEGLEIAHIVQPDIIITDIMMPVMDGLEMTRQLKADIQTSHIPVIVLTAKDSELDREDGYTAGADSYLTKPFSTHLLISRVNNILRSRENMANTAAPVMKLSATPASEEPALAPEQVVPEAKAPEMSALDRDFLDRLHNAVSEHISSENVDVAFLSDTMCMSRATLYRKVKALTGLSPNEYIRKVRMQVAEQLLAQGKFTVSEVSFKVGINSTPYFRQCFKEEFGVNPSDYVRSLGY